MRWNRIFRTLLTFTVVLAGTASATSILVADGGGIGNLGYGYSKWDNFSAALDTASGGGVVVAPDFNDLNQMLSFDALMLDQRFFAGVLGANEASNIAAFIATGRRVLMMGEQLQWANWNNQILGIVGGTFGGVFSGNVNSVVSNDLTGGASTLTLVQGGGVASGGTALYDFNFATLWGTNNNVLTVLDVNTWEDANWTTNNGGVFGTNVAEWLAADVAPVPEPATVTLLGLGLVGLVARARSKKAHAA